MKKILLKHGFEAIVDDEDYPYLSRFHWTLYGGKDSGDERAVREFFINRRTVIVPMWKFLIASENNKEVIYLNRNSLDNRKENLRVVPAYVANHRAEKKSRGASATPTSRYKGVSYSNTYQGHKKWIGDIVCNGKRYSKHFFTEREAAEFYNEKAREIYGEFAYQNVIEPLKHDWFVFKQDTFRCCRACGVIENEKITDGECVGKVHVLLR